MARPNKYDEKIKDKLTLVQGWARNGLTNEQIAKNLGINLSTLYKYQKQEIEFANAIKKGKEVVDFEVENALLKRAVGYDYQEKKIEESKEGRKITVTLKHVPPDVGACAIWLKNRKPEDWKDRKAVTADAELNSDGTITFNVVPASKKPEVEEE